MGLINPHGGCRLFSPRDVWSHGEGHYVSNVAKIDNAWVIFFNFVRSLVSINNKKTFLFHFSSLGVIFPSKSLEEVSLSLNLNTDSLYLNWEITLYTGLVGYMAWPFSVGTMYGPKYFFHALLHKIVIIGVYSFQKHLTYSCHGPILSSCAYICRFCTTCIH